MRNYSEIQNAFLDGMEEVFSIMFSDAVYVSLLDEESTEVNVYGETPSKVYHEPKKLIGRVKTDFEKGEEPIQGIEIDALITFPAKQIINSDLPYQSLDDFETLRRGKITFKNVSYLIEKVQPKTLVADAWQFYDFYCRVDKNESFSR